MEMRNGNRERIEIQSDDKSSHSKFGFTLVELLVVIAIIAVLVAILIPAVQRVRASARATQSRNNLSEMGVAMKHYEGLGKGNLRTESWEQTLAPFLDDAAAIFVDPADDDGDVSYALTTKVVSMGANDDKKIAIIESNERIIDLDTQSCSGTPLAPSITGSPVARHSGMTNALLYGGAVRSFEPAEIDLADSSNEPLVIWWLPYRDHGLVCGTVVSIDNPDTLPAPTGTDPEPTLTPNPSEPAPTEPPDNPNCEVTTGDLLVHYTFDDPGDPGYDDSGNGNHLNLNGPTHDPSERGGVIVLDGSNDYALAQQTIDITGDCYTIAGWFKTTASSATPSGGRDFFSLYANGGHGAYCQHAPTSHHGSPASGPWRYLHRMPLGVVSPLPDNVYARETVNDGAWHHFAAVKEDTAQVMYFDGAETERRDPMTQANFDEPFTLCIGRNHAAGAVRHWWGSLDDARIYGRALSASEISALANE